MDNVRPYGRGPSGASTSAMLLLILLFLIMAISSRVGS